MMNGKMSVFGERNKTFGTEMMWVLAGVGVGEGSGRGV
jgi:hypothetical protein